jgi:uncharacterized protein involved in exopolysaccharide biosynthesis
MLDRYTSEGPTRPDAQRAARDDHGKIAAFDAAGVRHPEPRPAQAAAPVTAAPAVAAMASAAVAHAEPAPADAAPLIDYRQLLDYAGFVVRSLLRHKFLASMTVVLVLGLTLTALLILPKSYHIETKLLAQRNAVMAALSNPGRAVPWDADAPTRAAAETILRRDNLIALITQFDLIREWEARRAPVLRFKDWVVAKVTRHTMTPDEKLDALVGLLEARMNVEAGPVGDGTVTIRLDWPDAEIGYRLVQGAQQAFLEARQIAETAAIGESIAILEHYSASLHQDIDRTLAELNRTQDREKATAVSRSRLALARRTPASAVPTIAASLGVPQLADSLDSDPDVKKLKATLDVKRQELSRIEETRQRQLNDLQARLAQLRAVYTSNNPTVQAVEQNIVALSRDQPQSLKLATEIEELQADYDRRVADATDQQIKAELTKRSAAAAAAAVGGAPAQAAAPLPVPEPVVPARLDASSEFVTLRLRSELNQLESVLERTDGARIELAVSQAAFKYRYTIVRPAQVPREPTSPNRRMMIVAGLFASLVLALVVVVSKDLLSNCILESWQIERQLGLPVLGTLRTA